MAPEFAPVEVVERTRRAQPVDAESVEEMARAWLDGTLDDAVMAAWCMAATLAGLEPEAVEGLTRALIGSGDRLELASLGPTGDVQSSGGAGDTTPVIAAPLAAALGVRVACVADRGRGDRLGTVDKLEAIPGFETELALAPFVRQVRDVGIAVAGRLDRVAPGEERLSALRAATGSAAGAAVEAGSLAARAVCGGAGSIVVHAPAGEGGTFGRRDADVALDLVGALATRWGRRVRWVVSDGDRPLGSCVGNALEIAQAARVLCGEDGGDLADVAIRMAGGLAEAAGVAAAGEGRAAAAAALADGRALHMAERWVEAQFGDPGVWTEADALPRAPERVEVLAPAAGTVQRVRPLGLALVARWLGAGRLHASQSIDPVVGVELLVGVGDRVERGDPLAIVHARDDWTAERARAMTEPLLELGPAALERPARVLDEGGRDA